MPPSELLDEMPPAFKKLGIFISLKGGGNGVDWLAVKSPLINLGFALPPSTRSDNAPVSFISNFSVKFETQGTGHFFKFYLC